MMKVLLRSVTLALFMCGYATMASGQDEGLSTPEKTIESLFKAMYDGDSTLAKSVFAEDAILQSVYVDKEGNPSVKTGALDQFINAIGSPHDKVWDERISNLKVQIDANLAQAWMDYSFFIGDGFSHCGVNAMHMVKTNGEWKLLHIIDTRRKSDCN